MMPIVVALTVCAAAVLVLAGYALGKGRIMRARAAWEQERGSLRMQLAAAEGRLQGRRDPLELGEALGPLQRDVRVLLTAAQMRETEDGAFRNEVRGRLASLERRSPAAMQMEGDLRRLVTPMLDRERVSRELSKLEVGKGGLVELPGLLDTIAEKAGFASLVLSDEAGLPLAASKGAVDVDTVAGSAAFFLVLSERATQASRPRPLSCVVLDETNCMTLHRMFAVGPAHFTVSAVARGVHLGPGALDPALSSLERILAPRALS